MKNTTKSVLNRLLRRNMSKSRVVGFILSNFIGMAIVLIGLQFYADASSIWEEEGSFIKTDYLVINKKVTSSATIGGGATTFSAAELSDLKRQPWVRSVGAFTSNDYKVRASVSARGRGMSTDMFFESIPDEYVDIARSEWDYRAGSDEVPIILSKEYLTLYNFGFATSAGMPQMSEGLMGSIPLDIRLTSEDGSRTRNLHGRIAGFSNRLNTIVVPQRFMDEMNRELGTGLVREPSRLIIDVSSPGDVAINRYLEAHDYEIAGDKHASSATFLLRVIVGIILGIGMLITLLSLGILILSISLIMERNRDKIHQLLMLGYEARAIGRPFRAMAVWSSLLALVLALSATWIVRRSYIDALSGLGAHSGTVVPVLVAGVAMTAIIIGCNIVSIGRTVRGAWRN